jgi:hypothetical protein
VEEGTKLVDGAGLIVAGKNKLRYEQPLLKRFGSVKMLTTGGCCRSPEGPFFLKPDPSGDPIPSCNPPDSGPHRSCF